MWQWALTGLQQLEFQKSWERVQGIALRYGMVTLDFTAKAKRNKASSPASRAISLTQYTLGEAFHPALSGGRRAGCTPGVLDGHPIQLHVPLLPPVGNSASSFHLNSLPY